MSSTNSGKNLPLMIGGLLVLAFMAVAAIKSGHMPEFIDLNGIVFVLAGGIALSLVTFSADEVRRALMHAAGKLGNDGEIRISILFWEALGRNFWILGGVRSV